MERPELVLGEGADRLRVRHRQARTLRSPEQVGQAGGIRVPSRTVLVQPPTVMWRLESDGGRLDRGRGLRGSSARSQRPAERNARR